jgi:GT2 family glycosyltransferase
MPEARIAASVIVPTFGRFVPLIETVRDLLKQDHPAFEVVVADQNPEWPADLELAVDTIKADPRVRWCTLPSPAVVAARNIAVEESRGDVLIFVDDDVSIPSPTFVRDHVRLLDDQTVAAIVGRECPVGQSASRDTTAERQINPWTSKEQTPLQQTMSFDRNGVRAERVCTFCTCNGSIRRSAFLSFGGFDELFTGNSYGDDYDLALRLNSQGFAIRYDPTPWLIHYKAPIGGLRLSDPANRASGTATAQGLWLFVLRHGHRGMWTTLLVRHVLRKTILLKRNIVRPWRQLPVIAQTCAGLGCALWQLRRGPQSRFTRNAGGATAKARPVNAA